jgi:hypothetical protein
VATLTHNGAGLDLGANAITVTSDYTNANFGTGNGFNNRADVTGTGKILASGNVAQALTGAVTGGTTATPTLAFGNVHVGSTTTLDYQIANTGTTGPSLRGAIETSVNGGNITDPALTGTGVTASSWGPVAAGAATANEAVTYAPTAGGALSGQAAHIANNFDNVASQTLAITGAAYNLASSKAIAPVSFVFHVGDGGGTETEALTVTNTAPAGSFSEGLDSSFGTYTSTSGQTPTFAGSITNLKAGSTDNTNMTVRVSTNVAGTFGGSVIVHQDSNGAIDGLANTPLADQDVGVSGSITGGVFNLAQATVNNTQPISFGNVRQGSTVTSQAISITNTAPVSAFTELLNGSVGSSPAGFTATGSFKGLAATSPPTANTSVTVGMDSSTAGAKSGNVSLNFVSSRETERPRISARKTSR